MFSLVIQTIAKVLADISGEFWSALAGAFFGAATAYYFQRTSEKQKRLDEQHGAILRAQLSLIGQFNTLKNIQVQLLDPFRKDPEREYKMVMMFQASSALAVNYDALAFLLDTKWANLVGDIHVAERCYQTSVGALSMRNDAVRQLHARSELQAFDPVTGNSRIKADPRDAKSVKDLTDGLFNSVDDSVLKIDAAIKELKKAGKAVFPKKRFLSLEDAKK